MARRIVFATVVFACFLLLAVMPAGAETRLALIIGNADYRHTNKLDNPVNDAKLIAATLKKQQFDVSEHIDADLRQMRRALQALFAKVERAGKDAVVAVYYAGHGVQVAGANFLIPVDAKVREAIRAQTPLLTRHPGGEAARDVEAIAQQLAQAS